MMATYNIAGTATISVYDELAQKIAKVLGNAERAKEARKMHNFTKSIDIQKNNLGDTRTADKKPSYKEFSEANRSHRRDVLNVMEGIASLITSAGAAHDDTKINHGPEFYADFCKVLDDPNMNFTDMDWYKMHIQEERHHINARWPVMHKMEEDNNATD